MTPSLIPIDPRATPIAPAFTPSVSGSLAFLPSGDLLVFAHDNGAGLMRVHQLAGRDGTWVRTVELKRNRGAPVGCAASADGLQLAVGSHRAVIHAWPDPKPVAKTPAVKYHLARESVGFSPSGKHVAVADGGYVAPMQKKLTVCDAATGAVVSQSKTREWAFTQVVMLDEGRVLTLGLPEDFEYGAPAFEGHRVLACYDTTTGDALWRRELHASQPFSLDAQGRVWVASDASPYITRGLVALHGHDGSVLRELEFGDWRPTGAAPVAIDATHVAVELKSSLGSAQPYVVIDLERGAQVALLSHPKDDVGGVSPASHAATRSLAAMVEGVVCVWRL